MEALVKEIIPGLYRLSIPLSFGPDYVHTFAVIEDKKVALLDTGPDFPESLSMYKKAMAAIGRSLEDVHRIFLTHYHADHCGFAGRIQEISGAEIYLSKIEYEAHHFNFPVGGRIDAVGSFLRQHGLDDAKIINSFCSSLKGLDFIIAPFTTDHFLTDGEVMQIGEFYFQVLLTPGHTMGHVCFFLPQENILLAGDNILPHITPNLSPSHTCPSFLPLENYIRSLEKIEDLPVKMVYPGHGEPFATLKGRAAQIKKHHKRRKDKIWNLVDGVPRTAYEISKGIFGSILRTFDRVLALNETYIHLLQLEKEGLIEQIKKDEIIGFKRR
jgi:glyoxylase-like metal-dependent hydrolase (beta-lactamase superfamily II)